MWTRDPLFFPGHQIGIMDFDHDLGLTVVSMRSSDVWIVLLLTTYHPRCQWLEPCHS